MPAAVISIVVMAMAAPALAQLQMQEQTVGAPRMPGKAPDPVAPESAYDLSTTIRKAARAKCEAMAKRHHIRDAKAACAGS